MSADDRYFSLCESHFVQAEISYLYKPVQDKNED